MPTERRFAVTILCLLLALGFAPQPVTADERVALVIGNAGYKHQPLKNPVNDAQDLAAALRDLDFTVIELTDADKRSMVDGLREFRRRLEPDGVALYFYAGHGVQWQGSNFLVPVGADIESSADLSFEALDAQRVLGYMEEAGTALNVVILDACRNNPFRGWSRSMGRGLARMDSIRGSIIAYSTQPGNTAEDGTGRNSPYTEKLLHYLPQTGLTIHKLFRQVGLEVMNVTDGRQEPWFASSPTPDFCFAGCDGELPPVTDDEKVSAVEVAKLLSVCAAHFKANRLTTGRGGNALACYEEVLRLDPANLAAAEGIADVADRYVQWTERALGREDRQEARTYIDRLRKVNPEHPRLAELQAAADPAPTPSRDANGLNGIRKHYVAAGRLKQSWPFAGGSSCCNCRTEHVGELPADFPRGSVHSVTFYLAGSRADSYYTRIRPGPTRLRLELAGFRPTASSEELAQPAEEPVAHAWKLHFEFDPPVKAGPGTAWRLLDGDDNIYSAVLLHASDVANEADPLHALPGRYITSGCQYAREDPAWYSVSFELGR